MKIVSYFYMFFFSLYYAMLSFCALVRVCLIVTGTENSLTMETVSFSRSDYLSFWQSDVKHHHQKTEMSVSGSEKEY